MKKYNISIDELDDEIKHDYELEYHGKIEKRLLMQTIYKVTDDKHSFYNLVYTHSGRKCRTQIGVKCTEAQKIEIEFLFNFYKRIWEEDQEALLQAFIQKHRIFGNLKDDEKGKELTQNKLDRIYFLMNGLSDEQPLNAISD